MLRIFSAFGIMAGFSSCLCLLSFSLFNGFVLSDVGLPLVVFATVIFTRTRNFELQNQNRNSHISLFDLGLYFSFVGFAAAFLSRILQSPHGNWDAWAIWNLRARFLFRGGDHWRDMFTQAFEGRHPEYPLLLPTLIAQFWRFLGNESVVVPILWALLFAIGTGSLLFAGLSILRGRKQGCLASSILLATPFFAQQAATQYADLPLAFYIVGTLVLLSLAIESDVHKNTFLITGGLFCGFAAWTKDEGILFALCVLLCWSIYAIRHRELISKQTGLLLAGIVPGLLTSLLFKFYVQDGATIYKLSEMAVRLSQASRYELILAALVKEVNGFPMVLVLYLFIVGIQSGSKRPGVIISMMILTMMVAGYILIYVITPHPLAWQLATSLNRLILQLWPAFLFFFFQIVRNPEELSSHFVGQTSGRQSLYA